MSYSLAYWILIFFWLIFGFWTSWPVSAANGKTVGGNILLFILFVLIGLQVFGKPLHG